MQGVYLLHFTPRFKHAGHYLGYADDIDARVYKHEFGRSGAKLIDAAEAAGVQFLLARRWPDADRDFERKLKGRKLREDGTKTAHTGSLARLCPICKEEKKRGRGKAEKGIVAQSTRIVCSTAQHGRDELRSSGNA